MQHIKIRIEDEEGKLERDISSNMASLLNFLLSTEKYDVLQEKYPWLLSIDPYGDTYFNYLQISHLVNELEQILAEHREKSQIILPFIDCFTDEIIQHKHLLVRCIGD